MICKYCNSQIKGDEKFCPYCGKQIGVPESWKCPQCNMNVREGTKYCPNCGSPIGSSSNNDFNRDAQNAFDRVKKVDWNEKKEGAFSFIKEFINNPQKIRLATKIIAILGASFIFILLITWGISLIGSCSSSLFGDKGPREICVTLQAETDIQKSPNWRMGNILSSSGNYGFNYNEDGFFTDDIIVPNGKTWTYKDYEANYVGEEGLVPTIRHYYMGYQKERSKKYDCRDDSRNMPIFRGGDKIRIWVGRWGEARKKTMDVKVYFVEKDDDLQTTN